MGRLARAAVGGVAVAVLAAIGAGCGHGPKPAKGRWHQVQRGDTLWALAQRYDTTVAAIGHVNDGVDPHGLRVGQKLWIPLGPQPVGTGGLGSSSRNAPLAPMRRAGPPDTADACFLVAHRERLAFEWPVLGTLTSSYGASRGRRLHDGIDLAAEAGTPVQAAEAGRVLYAGDELGDYGRVVVIKHQGHWATVYAHNSKNLVEEGAFVEKGDVVARVGETGNASAPHLHFEVRRSNVPHDPLSCLP